MPLLRRRMMMQQKKRTYLYHEGDTCDEITGGWEILTNATFGENCINLIHSSDVKKIKVANHITFRKLFIDMERVEPFSSYEKYSVRAYLDENEIIVEKLKKDERKVIEKEFTYEKTGTLTVGSYFGSYKIYNIWIE